MNQRIRETNLAKFSKKGIIQTLQHSPKESRMLIRNTNSKIERPMLEIKKINTIGQQTLRDQQNFLNLNQQAKISGLRLNDFSSMFPKESLHPRESGQNLKFTTISQQDSTAHDHEMPKILTSSYQHSKTRIQEMV